MPNVLTEPLNKLKELVERVIPTDGEPAQRVFVFPLEAKEINSAMGASNTKSPLVVPLAIVKEQWEGNTFRIVSIGAGIGSGCNQYETMLSVMILLHRGFLKDMVKSATSELNAQSWIIPFYDEINSDRSLGGTVLRVGYANEDTIFEENKGQTIWGEHVFWVVRFDLPVVIQV